MKRLSALALLLVITLESPFCIKGARPDYYQEYIEMYADKAVEEQKSHGIPASITLAQGLLESAAGKSRLAREGNNHFGIKCHSGWAGETMLRSDDAPNECFRVYDSVDESFADHSRFLMRSRYASLFENEVTDYSAWAHGLKQCGYATDPNYAERLISIIERYSLYLYDDEANRNVSADASFIQSVLSSTHKVRKSRGLHYVIASPGDTYEVIATELGIPIKKLMLYNDVKEDGEIKPWEEVYLVEKRDEAPEGISSATIGEGESLHSIAQRFGMKLSAIKQLNPRVKDKEGIRVKLR